MKTTTLTAKANSILQYAFKLGLGILLIVSNQAFTATITTPVKSAGAGANISGIGTVAWNTPGNVVSNDNNYATVSVNNSTSNYLQVTNYGFGIPTGATITGITVTIGRLGTGGSGSDVRDNVVKLVKSGSIIGTNLAVTGTDWGGTESAINYGGTTNLWGTTWTPTEINASDFGVVLAVNSANSRTASVDYITIAVTYNATYISQFTAMSIGSSNWCAGETRTVMVTVKNNGTATWTDGGLYPDVNIGVKWDAEGDYYVRTDAIGLAAGATQTYSLNVTAPATGGTNHLTFDVCYEGNCWLGNNNGSCGPGNSVYTSPDLSNTTAPVATNATNFTTSSFSANWNASTGATQYYLDVSTASDFSSYLAGLENLNVGNVTTYSVTGTTYGTTYYYRIRANTANCADVNSNTITVTTLNTNDYRSAQTGTWATLSTWQQFNGTTWVSATTKPTATSGIITIRNGHTVTAGPAEGGDQMTVEAGGQLTLSGGVTFTLSNGPGTDLTVNGVVANAGSMTMTGTAIFNDGAVYKHSHTNVAGTIPAATWNTGSTCEIAGYTAPPNGTTPGGIGQTFYNFTWNCASQSTRCIAWGASMVVNGTYTVQNTNSSHIYIAEGSNVSASLTGNYTQSGGQMRFTRGNGNATITISGDFTLFGGTLNIDNGDGGSVVNLAGNYNQSNGTINTGGSAVSFNFTKSGIQTFTKSGGTINAVPINFAVNSGATLDMGLNVLDGSSGTFILNTGAGIITAHSQGVSTSASTGCIQVSGTKTYSTGAYYTYNGTSAQVTGDGLTGANTLTISNNTGVTLSAALTTLTTLNIGTTVPNSFLSDGGNAITSNGTLNLASGSFRLGTSIAATAFPGFTSNNITAGTTVFYQAGVNQNVSTSPPYSNLTFSGANTKTTATGTLSIGGNWDVGSTTALNTNNTIVNLTGNITGNGIITQGLGLITVAGNWNHLGGFNSTSAGVTLTGSGKNITGAVSGLNFTTLTVNGTYSNNNTTALNISTALSGSGTLTQSTNARLNIAGTSNIAGLDASTHCPNYVSYTGSGNQFIRGVNYCHLSVSGSQNKTFQAGTTTINGNFEIGGNATAVAAAGLTITGDLSIINSLSNFSGGPYSHRIGGNWTNNSGNFQYSTGTVTFDGSGAQAINGSSGTHAFYNLVVDKPSGTLTGPATLVIVGNLTLTAGTLAAGGNISLYGNWTREAGIFIHNANTVSLLGNNNQTIGGSNSTVFYNLTINNYGGVTLGNNQSITGTLTLTNKVLSTGSYTLHVNNNSVFAISGGSATTYVNGNLRRNIASGVNVYNFPVGTTTAYAPIMLAFAAGSSPGSLTASTADGDHADIANVDIDEDASVNRNWTLSLNSGLSPVNYNAYFNWTSGDQDPGFVVASTICGKYSGSAWSYPVMGTCSGTQAQITGATSFSSFQLGKAKCKNPPTADAGTDQDICKGGSASLSGSIGGSASSGSWDDGGAGGMFSPNNTTLTANYSPPAGFTGDITLTLTTNDPAGPCTATADAMTMHVHALPTFSITSQDISCNELSDGKITITASGGNGNFTYSLLSGDNFPYSGTSPKLIENLPPNNYTIQVKDSNGCIQSNCN